MRLIETSTGEEAVVGRTYINYFRPPHKPASSGKCSTSCGREYFVGVLGLGWIEREDRGEGV